MEKSKRNMKLKYEKTNNKPNLGKHVKLKKKKKSMKY